VAWATADLVVIWYTTKAWVLLLLLSVLSVLVVGVRRSILLVRLMMPVRRSSATRPIQTLPFSTSRVRGHAAATVDGGRLPKQVTMFTPLRLSSLPPNILQMESPEDESNPPTPA
jgi:hypothetical protein